MSLLRAYLVDDEPLALERLARLLEEIGRVEIAGSSTDPQEALAMLERGVAELLFLDIEMPGMSGFQLLGKLSRSPVVVFTTAYDQYALEAFEKNSIDYLLKPVDRCRLERTLDKLESLREQGRSEMDERIRRVIERLTVDAPTTGDMRISRLPSKAGDRILFVELDRVTHLFSKDKLTYAAVGGKRYVIDQSLNELERKLDPDHFLRIHRAAIVQIGFIDELHGWFGGRLRIRLKNDQGELTVAREKVRELKRKLGLR